MKQLTPALPMIPTAADHKLWTRGLAFEVVITLALVLLLGASSLIYPFGKDQGEYAYIASAFLDGDVIYKDVFNVKPPLTHLLHAAAIQMFGHSMMSIRLFDWLWQAATAAVIVLLVNQLYRRRYAGMLAGVLYGATYFAADFWHTAQTDGFINLPISLSVFFFLLALRRERPLLWFCSGLAIGLATLLKYPIGLMLPALLIVYFLVWFFLQHGSASTKKETSLAQKKAFIHNALWVVAGVAVPLLLTAAALAVRGAWSDFLEIQLKYIPAYNAGFMGQENYLAYTWDSFVNALKSISIIQWFVFLLLIELILSATSSNKSPERWIVPLWGFVALFHVLIQNKYYPYHMRPILVPQAIILAHLVLRLYDLAARFAPLLRPVVIAIGALLPLVVISLGNSPYQRPNLGQQVRDLGSVMTGDISLEEYYQGSEFGPYGWGIFSSRANLELASYLQTITGPDDSVFLWAFEPGVYFLADRESASRFIYNFPLYGKFAWPAFRADLLDELLLKRPAVVVVAKDDAQEWVTGTTMDSQAALRDFAQLNNYIRKEYQPVANIAQFTVYGTKPIVAAFPHIERPYRAEFGQPTAIELHGFDLSSPQIAATEALTLTLFWRATGQVAKDYTVFVHLVDEEDKILAQADGPPLNGEWPTTTWRTGEAQVDQRVLQLPPEAVPGTFRLWIGLYDPLTGQRLGAGSPKGTVIDDRVLLTEFEVTP